MPSTDSSPVHGVPTPAMRNGAMLAAVVVLGLVLRVLGIAENPPGFDHDETCVAVNAALIAEAGVDQYGVSWPLFFRALDDYKDPLFVYAVALSVKLLGRTVTSARLPAALWGVVGLLVTYALGREVSGSDEGGVWSALFLAVTPWHIQYSRWSEQAIVLTVVHSAAVLFLIRLTRRRRVRDGVLAGLFLAAGFYAYSTAKLLVTATLAAFLVFAWRRGLLRTRAPIAFLGTFAVAALPFTIFYVAADGAMDLRFQRIRVPWSEVPAAFVSHLDPRFLFIRGEANIRHSTRTAMIPPVVALLGCVGAAVAATRRSLAGLAVVGIVLFTPTLGAFARPYPHASRTLTALPFVQVIAAVGTLYALGRAPARWRVPARILLVGILAAGAVGFWWQYWSSYRFRAREEWKHGLMPALTFAAQSSGDARVYAPTARYCDWMFVAGTPAAEVLDHREALAAGRDVYDSLDLRGKYSFLEPRATLGRRARAVWEPQNLRPGLWVLPLHSLSEGFRGPCAYENASYCVVRVP